MGLVMAAQITPAQPVKWQQAQTVQLIEDLAVVVMAAMLVPVWSSSAMQVASGAQAAR
jgi:hypothetical protein